MKIEHIEDLECWQIARGLVKMVYQMTNHRPISRDFALKDQMRKSAISVISNIAEGFETISNAEFCRFLNYAIRSLAELQSQLYVTLDVGYIKTDQFKTIFEISSRCKQMTKGLARYLRKKQKANTPTRQHVYTPTRLK